MNDDDVKMYFAGVLTDLSVINLDGFKALRDYWMNWTVESLFMKNVVTEKINRGK